MVSEPRELQRLVVLDSLRGVAAMSVVFHHCLLTFAPFYNPYQQNTRAWVAFDHDGVQAFVVDVLAYTPLHLFWGGYEAVMLFFVLSGFVLSLPFQDGGRPSTWRFLVRRVCRIYLPYAAALLASAGLFLLLGRWGPPAAASPWFKAECWSGPLDLALARDLLLMLGGDGKAYLDTVTWSLVHELRVSLVFPALAWLVLRWRWGWCLLGCFLWESFCQTVVEAVPGTLVASFFGTGHFMSFFVVGILLARHRERLGAQLLALGRWGRAAYWLVALALIDIRWEIPHQPPLSALWIFKDELLALGAAMAIAGVLYLPGARRLLEHPALTWLGRISYSLYLVHVIVLMSLVFTLGHLLPLWLVVPCVPLLALPVAALAYRWVEVPAIKLGKNLT